MISSRNPTRGSTKRRCMAARRRLTSGCRTANSLNSSASRHQRRSRVFDQEEVAHRLKLRLRLASLVHFSFEGGNARRNLASPAERETGLPCCRSWRKMRRACNRRRRQFPPVSPPQTRRARRPSPPTGSADARVISVRSWRRDNVAGLCISARADMRKASETIGTHFATDSVASTSKARVTIEYMHVCIRYNMERMRLNFFSPAWPARRNGLTSRCSPSVVERRRDGAGHGPLQLWRRCPPQSRSSIATPTITPARFPRARPTAETIDLTLEDALDRGLKYNLGLYLSNQTTAEARAARLQSLSQILPNINGAFAEEVQRLNLKSFGLTFPGFPTSVGPFGLTATQATGTWDAGELLLHRQVPCERRDRESCGVQLSRRARHRSARRGRELSIGHCSGIATGSGASRVENCAGPLSARERPGELLVWLPTSTPCAPGSSCRPSRKR